MELKFLSKFRKEKGLTQAALADMVGVSLNSIARYERGEVIPSANIAHSIANVLGCTESELLNGSDSQEFEVKIVMGVKSMTGLAGVEVLDNSFVYGVDDNKPQIVLAGKINVATPEDRKNALEEIIKKFHAACWMLDHKQDAEKGE